MDTFKPNSNKYRRIVLQFGIGMLLLTLGVGNIYFGHTGKIQYHNLLVEAAKDKTSQVEDHQLPFQDSPINLDSQARYINQLRGRISFYEFVSEGGFALLGVGLITVLFALGSLRWGDK